MSSIVFDTPSSQRRVSGVERKRMGALCNRLFLAAAGDLVGFDGALVPWFRRALPERHYLFGREAELHSVVGGRLLLERDAQLAATGDGWGPVLRDGRETGLDIVLNTVLGLGNDVVRLLPRLHGQCEAHAWVRGANRAWLARLVDGALGVGLLSAEAGAYDGWLEVVRFLRARSDEPVVTSYSVTEDFPDPRVIEAAAPDGEVEGVSYGAFAELPLEERWRLCMEALHAQSVKNERSLEMRPGCWSTYYFGWGTTVWDLQNAEARP